MLGARRGVDGHDMANENSRVCQTKEQMKTCVAKARGSLHSSERGILLLECLIYLSVVMIVFGAALGVFYNALEYSRRLQSNAEELVRALRVGEQWRADVRSSTGEIKLEKGEKAVAFCIPHGHEEVTYIVATNEIVRFRSSAGLPERLLSGVSRSSFNFDERGRVRSWRWELKLAGRFKAARVTPAFTFTAVAGIGVEK